MQTSIRSFIREVASRDPLVLGWARRIYTGLGLGEKDESDYLFDLARSGKDIFIVQVGANDGQRHDSLNPFIQRFGWRGLLLEPLPDIFVSLRNTYSNKNNVTLVNAALCDCDGAMTFYRVRPDPGIPDFCNELGSFHLDVVMKHASAFPQISEYIVEEKVRAISFPTLIRDYGVERIEGMVIDTEGHDYEILKLIDFQSFHPKLLIYEHAHLSNEDRDAAVRLLTGVGYKVFPIKKRDANTAAVYSGFVN